MERRINMSEDKPGTTESEGRVADNVGNEKGPKQLAAKSFFEKLSATAQLTRKRSVSQKASVVNDLEELARVWGFSAATIAEARAPTIGASRT
jgi:hypothetical protein